MTESELALLLKDISTCEGRIIDSQAYRNSSVVIPIIPGGSLGSCRILLEKRAEHMPQGREICLPGGGIEEGESSRDAGFRELYEETGLPPDSMGAAVYFGSLVNAGGRLVHVWMGIVDNNHPWEPNEEVERLFTLPLELLKNSPTKIYKVSVDFGRRTPDKEIPFHNFDFSHNYSRDWRGRDLEVLFYENLEETVWGMTAKILRDFVRDLYRAHDDRFGAVQPR